MPAPRRRADHEALGRELKRARTALQRFVNKGPRRDPATQAAQDLLRAIEIARCRLDSEACRTLDPQGGDPAVLTLYYGSSE